MVPDILTIKKFLLPMIIVVAGFLIGIIFEKIVLREIRKLSSKTKWESNEIFIKALHGTTTVLFLVAGVYLALESIELSPDLLSIIHKVLLVFVIFFVTLVLSRIAVGFVTLYSKRAGGAFISTSMFTNITRILVLIIGILIILQYLGISIAPILTALGVGGLAVALALQDTLSNLFAGIHVIASGKLKPGHYLRLSSGEEGYVTDITWRYTTIRSLQNNTIIVPNSKLASAIVTNFNIPDQKILISIEAGVSYDSDLEKVERVTIEVAEEVMKDIRVGVPGFEHVVTYKKFGESSVNFDVHLHVKEFVDQYAIKHEFIKRLHKRYREEGIQIPFPVRTVYMKEKI
ncbi:MAG TPA: mechanosensitive ion channel family protein [Syntrophales bacterium]|nr:mechanosensitive ion channel family protein [Syntrophales bacterium]